MMLRALLLSTCFSTAVLAADSAELAIPSDGGRLLIDRPVVLNHSVEIPENVTLEFTGNGRLTLQEGVTLTINGPLQAGVSQIFDGPGRVTGHCKVAQVPIQWFGAVADDDGDDSEAIRRAAELARYSLARKLLIPSGRYRFSGVIEIRCNVDCYGILEKICRVDEKRTVVSTGTFTPTYYSLEPARIDILPDSAPIKLDPAAMGPIQAGALAIPHYTGIKTLDPKQPVIDLEEGGTLNFSSTNFYSSRKCLKGDEYYTPNDYCKLVSPRGQVYPEFCFSYGAVDGADPWSADRTYRRGDFCKVGETLFKATFPSGPGSSYTHPTFGKADIPGVAPDPATLETRYHYTYADGTKDKVTLWVKVTDTVEYTPPQEPLTINGLNIEIRGEDPQNRTKPFYDSTLQVTRSNVTFNRMNISVKDPLLLVSVLASVHHCASLVFNECHFSGATQHGLGYNIMHGNAADITYNNCTSINARDAMAGRHGKNITINGGHYGCIDDHYGLNYTIRNASINALSTWVPGYLTPKADVSKWEFRPRQAIIIGGGGNITIENCRFYNALGIFLSRTDIGDLGGSVVIRDCYVKSDSKVDIATVMTHPEANFDYAHPLIMPSRLLIDNVVLDGKGKLGVRINHNQGPSFPLVMQGCDRLGDMELRNVNATFRDCEFEGAKFTVANQPRVSFLDCVFNGDNRGMTDEFLGRASGNLLGRDGKISWSLNRINPELYREK